MEVALSWLLVTVILGTATRHRVVGPNAAIAAGATVALCGLFAGPVSGASMNPADRSVRRWSPPSAPAPTPGALTEVWIYVLGPAAGAGLACLLILALKGGAHDGEVRPPPAP